MLNKPVRDKPEMNNETDLQLVRQARAGSHAAGSRLAERCRPGVFGIACRALGNADDAADVTQEALVYALMRLPDLRDAQAFPAWLRHVTLSRCADYRRQRATRRLGVVLSVLDSAGDEADHVARLAVRQSLSRLSDAQRVTLLLHYEGGWSPVEVAGLLDIPLNTVRSRLMAAKRILRAELQPAFAPLRPRKSDINDTVADNGGTNRRDACQQSTPTHNTNTQDTNKRNMDKRNPGKPMMTPALDLTAPQLALLDAAFPGARILAAHPGPEPWMPFSPRVRLALADGQEKTLDIRADITPDRAALLPCLAQVGIPGPRLIYGPTPDGSAEWLSVCEVPAGENLLLWTLDGTPHRIRLATERAFEAIDRLQGATPALLQLPQGRALPSRTLTDEADLILDADAWSANPWYMEASADIEAWRKDAWFCASLVRARQAAQDIQAPLVFTDRLHFFPNFLRIAPAHIALDEPLGWPGDTRSGENPLVEFVSPFGHLGDPLLGLAMVWVYDCYPFVHTGFVEQFLWRRNVTRREFAPRLAIAALQMIARDLPLTRPVEGRYWDSLRGWAEQALSWM